MNDTNSGEHKEFKIVAIYDSPGRESNPFFF